MNLDHRSTLRARLAAGLLVIAAGALIFAALASQLGEGHAMVEGDRAIADALRTGVPQAVHAVFAALTHLADPATLTALGAAMALGLWTQRRFALATVWVFAVAGNGLLNVALKDIFERARPLPADGATLLADFSFPSGHASGAVVAYGMLAYLAMRILAPRWHLPAWATAGTLVGLVGASRVVLGVHFASDVIAGFASGTAWLALCITGAELARWRGARHGFGA